VQATAIALLPLQLLASAVLSASKATKASTMNVSGRGGGGNVDDDDDDDDKRRRGFSHRY